MYGQLFMLFLETADNGKGCASVHEIKVELLGKQLNQTISIEYELGHVKSNHLYFEIVLKLLKLTSFVIILSLFFN